MVNISKLIGEFTFTTPSWTAAMVLGAAAERTWNYGQHLLAKAGQLSAPGLMDYARKAQLVCDTANIISKPLLVVAIAWAGYVITRHLTEPPPYEAPEGTYPNGGPIIEIAQEEARNKEMVFACPAPLARIVQERVLLCERDPTMIQKTKSIASKWCDQNGLNANERYQAICGAVAAALTVPINEQQVIKLAASHAVQLQYGRLATYLSGIKHQSDPWYTKYMLYRR